MLVNGSVVHRSKAQRPTHGNCVGRRPHSCDARGGAWWRARVRWGPNTDPAQSVPRKKRSGRGRRDGRPPALTRFHAGGLG